METLYKRMSSMLRMSVLGLVVAVLTFGMLTEAKGQEVTVGTGTSAYYSPIPGWYGWQYDVYVYDVATSNNIGANITSIAYNISQSNASTGSKIEIWMKDVPAGTTLSSSTTFASFISGATPVVTQRNFASSVQGWQTITFDQPHCHTAGNAILVAVRGIGCATDGGCARQAYYTSATGTHWYKRNDGTDPGQSVSGTVDAQRANVILNFTGTCSFGGGGGTITSTHNVPQTGNDTWTTCDGRLYDHAGPSSNYANNCNGYTVIYPETPGSSITIQGTYVGEGGYDYLKIYDGVGTGGTLLGNISSSSSGTTMTVGPFTVTSGAMTVQFTSDGSNVYAGFDLQVTSTCSGSIVDFGDCEDYVIGTGTGTTSNFPIRSYWNYNYSQQIYTAAELAGVNLEAGSEIRSISFEYVSGGTVIANYNNWTVYLANTTKSNFTSNTDWIPIGNFTQVFSGNITIASGWVTMNLTTPFVYTGQNLCIAVDENVAGNSGTPSASWRCTATTNTGYSVICYSDDTNNSNHYPASPGSANLTQNNRPNVKLNVCTQCEPIDPLPTFASTTATTTYNCTSTSTFASPDLQNVPLGAAVTYTSSNTNIATVANNGTVTVKSCGTVTITARVTPNDEDLCAAQTSYTLHIDGSPATPVLATDLYEIYAGEQISLPTTTSWFRVASTGYHNQCATTGTVTATRTTLSMQNDFFDYLRLTPTAADPYVTLGSVTSFAAAQNPYFVLRYKTENFANTDRQAQLFWTRSDATSFTEDKSTHFTLITDGQWHTAVVDLREVATWTGTITGLRLDYLVAYHAGSSMLVDYVGVTDITNETSTTTFFPEDNLSLFARNKCGENLGCASEPVPVTVILLPAPPAEVPYFNDFESGEAANYEIINPNTNYWMIGTAAGSSNGGTRALYITNNNSSYTYSNGSVSYSYAYRDISFPAAGQYVVQFDWKCNGESSYDLVRAFLVPTNVDLTTDNGMSGYGTTSPTGWLSVSNPSDKLNLNTADTWTRSTALVTVGAGTYRLLFFWKNDGNSGSTPAGAIDNIAIAPCSTLVCGENPSSINTTVPNRPACAGGTKYGMRFYTFVAPYTGNYTITFPNSVAGDPDFAILVNNTTCVWRNGDSDASGERYYSLDLNSGDMIYIQAANHTTEPSDFVIEISCPERGISDPCDIIVGTGTNTDFKVPVNNSFNHSYSQTIYTPAQIGRDGVINEILYQYASTTAMTSKTNVQIYMGHTSINGFTTASSWIGSLNMTLVYDGPLNCTHQGWNAFVLQRPFYYNGRDNLVVAVLDNSGAFNGTSYTFYQTVLASDNNATMYSTNNQTSPINILSPPSSRTITNVIPNTSFCMTDCSGEVYLSVANDRVVFEQCDAAGISNAATANVGGEITYTSLTPYVATVEQTATDVIVRPVGAGEAVIRYEMAPANGHCGGMKTYNVSVGTPHELRYHTTDLCVGGNATPISIPSVTGMIASVTEIEPYCDQFLYFNGWSTSPSGGGNTIGPNSGVNLGCGDVDLYAVYSDDNNWPDEVEGTLSCDLGEIQQLCGEQFTTTSRVYAPVNNSTEHPLPSGVCSFLANGTWWYMRIEQPGNLEFKLYKSSDPAGTTSGGDLDFACWGPFDNPTCDFTNDLVNPNDTYYYFSGTDGVGYRDTPEFSNTTTTPTSSTASGAVCTTGALARPFGNLMDFGGSTSYIEYLHIENAMVGQYYMIAVANYVNSAGYIHMEQMNNGVTMNGGDYQNPPDGMGISECDVSDCPLNIFVDEVTYCDEQTGTYNIFGRLEIGNLQNTGNSNITLSYNSADLNTTIIIQPPYQESLQFSFTDLRADGQEHIISANYVTINPDFTTSHCGKNRTVSNVPPSCEIECPDNLQANISAANNTTVLGADENGIIQYAVCLQEGTTPQGINLFGTAVGFTDPTYQWTINAHDGTMPITLYEQNPSFTPTSDQGYDIYLLVKERGNNCEATSQVRVVVSKGIQFDEGFSVASGDVCIGGSDIISVGETEGSDVEIRPQVHEVTNRLGVGETRFIPDGRNCGTGNCFESSVIFSDFAPNAIVRNANDIEFIKLNMEHSFVSDLQIEIVCPDGHRAILLPDYYSNVYDSENYMAGAIGPETYEAYGVEHKYYISDGTNFLAPQIGSSATITYPSTTITQNTIIFSSQAEAQSFIDNIIMQIENVISAEPFNTGNATYPWTIKMTTNTGTGTFVGYVTIDRNNVADYQSTYLRFDNETEAEHFIVNNQLATYNIHSIAFLPNVTFGTPDLYDYVLTGDATSICDAEFAGNVHGVGATYAWTSNSDYTTVGYVYDAANIIPSENILINGTPAQIEDFYQIKPSNVETGENMYQPLNSFDALNGCPLNGTWTIKVCDSWQGDNGYIFNWEIAFDHNLNPNDWEYTVELEDVDVNCAATYVSVLNPSNNIEIAPTEGTATGEYDCQIQLTDNFGCVSTVPLHYSVSAPTLQHISGVETQEICAGQAITPINYEIGGNATSVQLVGDVPEGISISGSTNPFVVEGTVSTIGNYTFDIVTVSPAGCLPVSRQITINVSEGDIEANFAQPDDFCEGVNVEQIAAVLTTTSPDGIRGSWTPEFTTNLGETTYTFHPEEGQCAVEITRTVNIIAKPILNAPTNNVPYCKGTTAANISLSSENITDVYINDGDLPEGLTFNRNLPGGPATITGTPTEAGDFTITVLAVGNTPCSNATQMLTISVIEQPTLQLTAGTAEMSICSGSEIGEEGYPAIVYTYGGSARNVTVSGLPENMTFVVDEAAHTVTITGTPTANVNYSLTTISAADAPCDEVTLYGNITIGEPTELILFNGGNAEACIGTGIPIRIDGQYSGNTEGVTVADIENLPAGITWRTEEDLGNHYIVIEGTVADDVVPGDYDYTIIMSGTSALCPDVTNGGTISVGSVEIVLTSATGTDNQNLCINGETTQITEITYSYGPSANNAAVFGLEGSGLQWEVDAEAHTVRIWGTPTQAGRYDYYVENYVPEGDICKDGDQMPGTIQIGIAPTLNSTGTLEQTKCNGEALTEIVLTYGGGAIGLEQTGDLPEGVTATTNAENGTVTLSGAPTENGDFVVTFTTQLFDEPNPTTNEEFDNHCATQAITVTIHVNDMPAPTITPSLTSLCNGTNLELSATPAGLASYRWTADAITTAGQTFTSNLPVPATGQNMNFAPTVSAGSITATFTLTVRNDVNCQSSATQEVVISASPTATLTTQPNIRCDENYNGSIIVSNLAGGSEGSTYTIQANEQTYTSTGENVNIANLAPGDYTITISNSTTDAACNFTQNVNVADEHATVTVEIFGANSLCTGSTAELEARATNATNPTYLWNTDEITQTITTVELDEALSYSVTIIDENGCTATDSHDITVGTEPKIDVWQSAAICIGAEYQIRAVVNNISGTPDFTWHQEDTNPAGAVIVQPNSLTTDLTFTQPGTYQFYAVVNAPNCANPEIVLPYYSEIITIVVNAIPVPQIIPDRLTVNCANPTATLTASTIPESTTATYAWSTNVTENTITTPDITTATIYTVTVTENNCRAEASVTIEVDKTNPEAEILQPASNQITCANPSIDLVATGGDEYSWSTGSIESTINVTTQDDYVVTVTNSANGCSDVAAIEIEADQNIPTVSIANLASTELNCRVNTITLTAVSSSNNVTYQWQISNDNGANWTNIDGATGVSYDAQAVAGYRVAIIASNGCEAVSELVQITENIVPPMVEITPEGQLTCANNIVRLTASGANTYQWLQGNTTTANPINALAAGTYQVQGTAVNGCTATAEITLTIDDVIPEVHIETTDNQTVITCNRPEITLTAISETEEATLTWTNQTVNIGNIAVLGNYSVFATGPNGCTNTANVHISVDTTQPEGEIIAEDNIRTLTCQNQAEGILLTVNPQNDCTYEWQTGLADPVRVSTAGTYTTTITNPSNGCTNEVSITINDNFTPPTVAINEPQTRTLTCSVTGISLSVNQQARTNYEWFTDFDALTSTGTSIATGVNIRVEEAGTYTVVATNTQNGCTASSEIVIDQNVDAPEVEIISLQDLTVENLFELTCDVLSIPVLAQPTDPSTVITRYQWSGGGNRNSANNTLSAAGEYFVTVYGQNGCTNVTSVTIIETVTRPDVEIAVQGYFDNGVLIPDNSQEFNCYRREIRVDAQGNGVSYEWFTSNGTSIGTGTTIDLQSSYNGQHNLSYYVIASGDNGCPARADITFTEDYTLPTVVLNSNDRRYEINCAQDHVTVTVESAAQSYLWDTGETTASITYGTEDGHTDHWVQVTGANGCSVQVPITITQDFNPPSFLIFSQTDNGSQYLNCSRTAINLRTNGDERVQSYMWGSPLNISGNSVMVSQPGSYSVTATAVNGCTAIQTFDIWQDLMPPQVSIVNEQNITQLSCIIDSIHVWAVGGVSYQWNQPNFDENFEQYLTEATTYIVTVTGNNGCTASTSINITSNTMPPDVNVVSSRPDGLLELSCNIDRIGVRAEGNGMNFVWEGGNNPINSTNIYMQPGTYHVTTTGNNGCTNVAEFEITSNFATPEVAITSANGAYNFDCHNDVINLIAGGTGNTYRWSNGTTTQNCTVDMPGTYAVTVTGQNGCTASATVQIQDFRGLPNPAITNLSGTNELTCTQNTIRLEAAGGVRYTWSNGSNSPIITIATPGIYTVVAYDDNGCDGMASVEITQGQLLNAEFAPISPINCYGETTSANVNVISGTPPYQYLWADGSQNSYISDVQAGPLTVTINDANGCIQMLQTTIAQPQRMSVTLSKYDVVCGNTLGRITVVPTGGTISDIGYSYTWSHNQAHNQNEATNLSVGTYHVTVKDENNCPATAEVNVTMQGMLNINSIISHPVSCYGYNDGSVIANCLNCIDEATPLNYAWNTGEHSQEITNLFADTYSVSVTDNWGCTGVASVSITQPQEVNVQITTHQPSCYNAEDGSISVIIAGNAGTSYSYQWQPVSNNFSVLDSIAAGNYTVTIHDDNYGCDIVKYITLDAPPQISVLTETTNVNCYGDNAGTIKVNVEGGTNPYRYQLEQLTPLSASNVFANLNAGFYNIVVVDNNNCSETAQVLITQPEKLQVYVSKEDPMCRNSRTGKIAITANGGTQPYIYFWDNNRSDVPQMANIPEGNYSVGVIDNNGCISEAVAVELVDIDEDCIRIPNVFTPNGDGINDTWIIDNIEMFPDAHIYVFNRWGQMLYQERGNGEPWNGEYKGKFVPAGTYLYIIDLFNNDEPYEGTVTILY